MSRLFNGIAVKVVFFGCLVITSACDATRDQLANVGKVPSMTESDSPMEKPSYKPIYWPEEEKKVSLPNSLWQQGAHTFFRDHRARSVGDILRVSVEIDDKAQLDNKTERKRDGSRTAGAPNVFGLEHVVASKLLPDAADPTSLLSVNSASDHKGTGKIDRKEKIRTEIAAMVTQILPNGNLVIRGSQEVRVNYEVREVSIAGIVRPEDISADNSIDSTQVAEARISYGGRGQLSDIQQPPIGTQVMDILSPF